jgi:hypothetical protein
MNQVELTARLDCFRAEAVISIAVLDSVAPDDKRHSATIAGRYRFRTKAAPRRRPARRQHAAMSPSDGVI